MGPGVIVTNCDVLGKTATARGESGSRVERRNQLITWQWVLNMKQDIIHRILTRLYLFFRFFFHGPAGLESLGC